MSLVERALKKIQESRVAEPRQPLHVASAAAEAAAASGPPTLPLSTPELAAQARTPSEPRVPKRVVQIDRAALRAEAVLPPEKQERQIADQYRHIKRPLIDNAIGRGGQRLPLGQLIMVASAMAGEGKTFTSVNLALSMALERDLSVVLIDADVAKPRLSSMFDLRREPGLLDLLRDETLDIDSLILPTTVPGLSILPVGRQSDTATELLASARMQQVATHLAAADSRRIVLFDSPPLLLTSESRVLSAIVGQVALVVRAEFTPQQAVLEALDLLGEGKAIGLVLNQCNEQSGGYYQYYGERDAAAEEQT